MNNLISAKKITCTAIVFCIISAFLPVDPLYCTADIDNLKCVLSPQLLLSGKQVHGCFQEDYIRMIINKQYGLSVTIEEICEDYKRLLISREKYKINPVHIMTDKINNALDNGRISLAQLENKFMSIPDISEMSINRSYSEIWVPTYVPSWNKDNFTLIKEITVQVLKENHYKKHRLSELVRRGFLREDLTEVTPQIAQLISEIYNGLENPEKLITICGIVAAGKSELAKALEELFWLRLETDNYKVLREIRRAQGLEGAAALDEESMLKQIKQLLAGESVYLQKIDKRKRPQEIEFNEKPDNLKDYKGMVLEGAYAWFWPEMEELSALKISVIDNTFMRLVKKSKRDGEERGYSPAENLFVLSLAELEEGPQVLEKQIYKSDVIVDYSGYQSERVVRIYKRKQFVPTVEVKSVSISSIKDKTDGLALIETAV